MSLVKKVDLTSETSGTLAASRLTGYPPATTGTYRQAANQAARLAAGAVVGDITLQIDTGDIYLCTALPSNDNANWGIWGGVIAPVNATDIVNTPAGGISATTAQAAIDELDSEKATKVSVQNQSLVSAADTGAADAYAIACSPAIAAYVTGQRFSFIAVNANTGASTLAVNGLAATAIRKNVTEALVAGDIAAGQIIEVVKDATNFQLVSRPPVPGLPYVKLSDTKAAGTEGGTPTAGSWQTHTVNTEDSDTAAICALAANQFTLSAGTYTCNVWATFYKSNRAQIKIRNTTGASDVLIGSSEYSDSPNAIAVKSFVQGKFTVAAAQALEVQYQVGNAFASQGLGVACNFGVSEVYLVAEFEKVA